MESRLWNSRLRRLIAPALVSAGPGLLWGDNPQVTGYLLAQTSLTGGEIVRFPATLGAEFVRLLDIFPRPILASGRRS
jgi:hypothetical protein